MVTHFKNLTMKEKRIVRDIEQLKFINILTNEGQKYDVLPCIISFDYKEKSNYVFTTCGGMNLNIHGLNSLKRIINKKTIYKKELE